MVDEAYVDRPAWIEKTSESSFRDLDAAVRSLSPS